MNEDREATVQKVLGMIEEGMTQKDAAVLAGASERTWHRWKKEDGSIGSRVEASLLRYKQKLINVVNIGSLKDPKLALEMLARRYSDEYGAKNKVEVVDPQAEIRRMMGIIKGTEPEPNLDEDDEHIPENGGNLLPEQGGEANAPDTGAE